MREILFRGKRTNDGEWVYGRLAAYDLICPGYPEDVSDALGEYCNDTPYVGFIEVDPKTVGQFIGYFGDNKYKVFEGDIFETTNIFHPERKKIYHLEFVNAGFYAVDIYNETYHPSLLDLDLSKIIGNIHDNPELLED